MLSIACSTNGNVVAAGYQSYVTVSTDSGATWSGYHYTGGSLVNFLAMSADGHVMMAGGYVSVSTDTGTSWNTTSLGNIGDGGVAVSQNGGLLVVAGHTDAGIYTSTNLGATWQTTPAPNANYNGLGASADGSIIVAAAYADGIYVSTNSGATFSHTNMFAPWYGAGVSADGSKLVIQAFTGEIYISTDHGASWGRNGPPISDGYWTTSALTANGNETFVSSEQSPELWVNLSFPANPAPLSLALTNHSSVLSWPTLSYSFTLQRSTDLINWIDVPSPVTTNGFSFQVTDLPQGGKAFYRLKSP